MNGAEHTQGQRVRIARKFRNLTQEDLSKILGVTNTAISHIESGKSGLTTENALTISQHLKVDIDWLLSGKGDMSIDNSTNTVSGNKTKGDGNNVGIGGTYNRGAGIVDECWERLRKAEAEIELWRNKYITLLERSAGNC